MIIVMEENATEEQIVRVVDRLIKLGFDIHRSTGARYTLLGAVGSRITDPRELELLEGVNKVVRVSAPYKLAARAFKPEGTKIEIGDVAIGGEQVVVMAGPGVVESREQMETIAGRLAKRGVRVLRGGAFRTSDDPYGFQGLGEEGLKLLREVADRHRMLTHSTIFDAAQLPLFARYVDINQVCERGIRTFETYTRQTLDLSAIPVIKKLSSLPIIVDPSRAMGRRDKVPPMARAAVAAGADGLLIEVHHDPDHALSDGAQSLTLEQFDKLIDQLRLIASAVERAL